MPSVVIGRGKAIVREQQSEPRLKISERRAHRKMATLGSSPICFTIASSSRSVSTLKLWSLIQSCFAAETFSKTVRRQSLYVSEFQ